MKGWMKDNNVETRFEECIDRSKLTETLTGSADGKYTNEDGNEQNHSNYNHISMHALHFYNRTRCRLFNS